MKYVNPIIDDIINGNDKHTCLWGHQGRVWSLVKIGKWLISGGEDGIFIWNLDTLTQVKFIPIPAPVWNLAKSGSQVYAGCQNGALLSFDIELETQSSSSKQITPDLSNVKFGQVHKLNDLILFGEVDKLVNIYRYNIEIDSIRKTSITLNRYHRSCPSFDKKTILVQDAKEETFYVVTDEEEISCDLRIKSVRSITSIGTSDWLIYSDTGSVFKVSFHDGNLFSNLISDSFILPQGKDIFFSFMIF